MKIKTFHALTMQDAMRAIKQELGPDAIILSSKTVQQGGQSVRLRNRPVLEVMAAAEPEAERTPPPAPVSQAQPSAQSSGPSAFQQTLQSLLTPPVPVASTPVSARPKPGPVPQPAGGEGKKDRMQKLRGELHELSRLLGASLPPETQSLGGQLPAEVLTFCRALVSQGLRPSTAESIGHDLMALLGKERARSHEAIHGALHGLLAARIRVSGPLLAGRGDRTISLMLGPSGAGKTTVITKLAAHYRLEEKQSVAIITFDTYRQASVEQLRMYAGVLGVPFASARSARQVCEGLRRHAHADVVLIDMPGIGPDEIAAAKELHYFLKEESEMNMHLVVAASTREHDLLKMYERVKDLPSLRLLFTKLDETESFGTVFELAYQTGVPLSYWSAGQRVPEDLEVATPQRLAAFLVDQRYSGRTGAGVAASQRSSSLELSEPVEALTGQER